MRMRIELDDKKNEVNLIYSPVVSNSAPSILHSPMSHDQEYNFLPGRCRQNNFASGGFRSACDGHGADDESENMVIHSKTQRVVHIWSRGY